MILNISHSDRKMEHMINEFVGRSYSIWESIKMGGSGSQRMRILDFHEVFDEFLKAGSATRTCNIELRPKGIGIRFRYKLEVIGWFTQYYQLDILTPNNEIHIRDDASGHFLILTPNNRFINGSSFLKKLHTLKEN